MLVVDDWLWFIIYIVQDVMDGQFKFWDFWGGMKEDMIQVLDFGLVVFEVVVVYVKEIIVFIIDGLFNFFIGLIKD